jgi:hypothetical protein
MILWREKRAYFGVLTSVHKSKHGSGLFRIVLSDLAVVFVSAAQLSVSRAKGAVSWREAVDRILSQPPGSIVVPLTMFITCLATMFMTGSRAVILFLLALVVAFNLYF